MKRRENLARVAHLLRQKACQRKAREAERVFFRNIPRTTSSKDVRILENCKKKWDRFTGSLAENCTPCGSQTAELRVLIYAAVIIDADSQPLFCSEWIKFTEVQKDKTQLYGKILYWSAKVNFIDLYTEVCFRLAFWTEIVSVLRPLNLAREIRQLEDQKDFLESLRISKQT